MENETSAYDLFISHSSNDKEFAQNLIETLRGSPFNLRCSWSYEDFIPGRTTAENVDYFIQNSKKTVTVLSPSFMASGWCHYEATLLHTMATEENNNRHIPVLYKNCRLPVLIKVNSYIDAQNASVMEVCHRIRQALNAGNLSMGMYYGRHDELIGNGSSQDIYAKRESKLSYQFVDLSPEETNGLMLWDIKKPLALYYNAAKRLNRSRLLTRHRFLGSSASRANCCFSQLVGMMVTIMMVIIMWVMMLVKGFMVVRPELPSLFLLSSPLMGLLCWLMLLSRRRWALMEVELELHQLNIERCRKHNAFVVFSLSPVEAVPTLTIVNYDMESCAAHLSDHVLLERVPAWRFSRRKNGEQLCPFKEYVPAYTKVILSNSPRAASYRVVPSQVRHFTVNKVMCFCQFVEHRANEDGRQYIRMDEFSANEDFVEDNDRAQIV